MSNEFFELHLVRTDGFDIRESSLGCYISVEGHLKDVITPLTEENEDNGIELHESNALRLIVKNMGDSNEVLGSITFPSCILPKEGPQWLPLFSDLSNDFIELLPQPVQSPKILVMVKKKAELSPIEETTELSDLDSIMQERALFDYDSKPSSEFPTPKSVRSGCKTTLHLSSKDEQAYKNHIESLIECLEEQKSISQKFEELYKEALDEGEESRKSLEEEKIERAAEFSQIQELTKEYNETVEVISRREESLNLLLEDKDEEILQLKSREIEEEKKIRELEKQNSELLHLNNILKHELHGGGKGGEKEEAKNRRNNREGVKTRENRRSLDACIAEFSKRICKPNLFTKLEENVYLVNKKKVFVTQKNGELLCRIGGGFEPIETYLQGIESSTPKKGHRRYYTFEENIPSGIETEPSDANVFEERRAISPSGKISRTPLASRNKQKTKRLPFK